MVSPVLSSLGANGSEPAGGLDGSDCKPDDQISSIVAAPKCHPCLDDDPLGKRELQLIGSVDT